MYLKVVIKDQVEDTKFAQEKHIFSMYFDSNLIEARNLQSPQQKLDSRSIYRDFFLDRSSIAARSIELHRLAKISNAKKLITYSFEARIDIHLNRYLKDIISHLLEGFLDRETLCLCSQGFVTKISLFHQTKKFQSRSEDSIGKEAKVIATTTNLLL